jgi:DNA gyrase/topoisomerase IV subunit B
MNEVYPDEIPTRIHVEKFEPVQALFAPVVDPESNGEESEEVSEGEEGGTQESLATAQVETPVTEHEEDDFEPGWSIVVRSRAAGGERRTVIDRRTLMSRQADKVRETFGQLGDIAKGPFEIHVGEKETPLASLHQVLEHVLQLGRKGIDFQRYKGLGEMNPDQLWETTMDPSTRTLLQVRIDDSVEADGVFTVLMGDSVEPRRAFIERNALSVKNLDV